jgi:hypothetical protein
VNVKVTAKQCVYALKWYSAQRTMAVELGAGSMQRFSSVGAQWPCFVEEAIQGWCQSTSSALLSIRRRSFLTARSRLPRRWTCSMTAQIHSLSSHKAPTKHPQELFAHCPSKRAVTSQRIAFVQTRRVCPIREPKTAARGALRRSPSSN